MGEDLSTWLKILVSMYFQLMRRIRQRGGGEIRLDASVRERMLVTRIPQDPYSLRHPHLSSRQGRMSRSTRQEERTRIDTSHDNSVSRTLRDLSNPHHDSNGLIRLMRAFGLLTLIFVVGMFGYYIIGDGEYSLLTCAYMTIITLTSIGFGEVIPIQGHPDRVVFTIVLVILGLGMMLYFVSQLTAFVIDGELRDILFRQRMRRTIEKLDHHFIVAGLGSTGRYVLDEMLQSGKPVLVIEQNRDVFDRLDNDSSTHFHRHVPLVQGMRRTDSVLQEAGIERAAGIVFALGFGSGQPLCHHHGALAQPPDADRDTWGESEIRGEVQARWRHEHHLHQCLGWASYGSRGDTPGGYRVPRPDDA